MNENYITGLVDSMLILNETISDEVNPRTSVHYDPIGQNYNIIVAYDTAYDNRLGEEVSDFIQIIVPEQSMLRAKKTTLFEIYFKLEFLEKIKFDHEYDSVLKAKEHKDERDGDNWRKEND